VALLCVGLQTPAAPFFEVTSRPFSDLRVSGYSGTCTQAKDSALQHRAGAAIAASAVVCKRVSIGFIFDEFRFVLIKIAFEKLPHCRDTVVELCIEI